MPRKLDVALGKQGDVEVASQGLAKLALEVSDVVHGLAGALRGDAGLRKAWEEIEKSFETFQRNLVEQLRPVSEKFAEFARALEEYNSLHEELSNMLASRGWIVIPLVPLDLLRYIKSVASVNPDGVDQLLVEFYRSKVPQYASELLDYDACREWVDKIQHAFDAHTEQLYDLAIPMWLIIIDGVARQVAQDKGFKLYQTVGTLAAYRKRVRKITKTSSIFGEPYQEALLQVLYLMSRGTKAHQPEQGVNRHLILHGLDPNFGSERESIQCLNTLLMFCVLSEPSIA
jgi:hypothetical protein